MGVDNWVSVVIKNWWKQTWDLEITVLDIIGSGTVIKSSERCRERIEA